MRRTWLVTIAALVLIGGAPSPATAQRPLNLDFERASVAYPDRPWGWTFGWSAFAGGPAASFTLDSTVFRAGRRSLRISAPDPSEGADPHAIMLQLPSNFVLGRDVRLEAWTRTTSPRATAMIAIEAWRDRAFAAADTARSPAVAPGPESGGWARHEVRILVPDDPTVHSLVITLALDAAGTVWFDELSLFVDGEQMGTLPAVAAAPADDELAWLRRHAVPLSTVRVSADGPDADDDLRLIGDIVGGARIVGLGESTHGTREFFQVKHRLLDYLVREHGFTVFAIEANQLAVERVNRYVQDGIGTAQEVIRVMFRVWNTEEMLDLIEWMRAHNASGPAAPVRFVGYDMQDHRTPADSLRAFLQRTEPALLARLEALTAEYRAQPASATPNVADTVRARWAVQADSVWAMVSRRRASWLETSSTRADTLAVEWALQAARLLRQAARFNVELASPERDSLMAANLDWVLRHIEPDARAVVWAHDVHVSHGGDAGLSFNGGEQMGAYLRRFGHDYRALSLLTYEGTYSATRSFIDHRMIEAEAFPAPPGSLEAALHRLERPERSVGWVVDLRPARTEDAAEWLRSPRPIRHIGFAAYDYGFEFTAVLPLEFDGIVFIDRTAASRLLRR